MPLIDVGGARRFRPLLMAFLLLDTFLLLEGAEVSMRYLAAWLLGVPFGATQFVRLPQ
jgi:hypothetical protein